MTDQERYEEAREAIAKVNCKFCDKEPPNCDNLCNEAYEAADEVLSIPYLFIEGEERLPYIDDTDWTWKVNSGDYHITDLKKGAAYQLKTMLKANYKRAIVVQTDCQGRKPLPHKSLEVKE